MLAICFGLLKQKSLNTFSGWDMGCVMMMMICDDDE